MRMKLFGCLLAISVATGCSPIYFLGNSPYSLASGSTTLPRASWEGAVIAGAGVEPGQYGAVVMPAPELLTRVGLSENWDIGLRTFNAGAAAEGRYQLSRAQPEDGPSFNALIAILAGLRLGLYCVPGGLDLSCSMPGVSFARVGIVAGLRFGWFELVVAAHPTVEWQEEAVGVQAGVDLALTIHLPRGWRIAPEGSIALPYTHQFRTGKTELKLLPNGHFGIGVFKAF